MVVQKIKDIDHRTLKYAKGVMAVMEMLGITEDDLSMIKRIPAMEAELKSLREFKEMAERTLSNRAEAAGGKPVAEILRDTYNRPSKEFKPHYGGQ